MLSRDGRENSSGDGVLSLSAGEIFAIADALRSIFGANNSNDEVRSLAICVPGGNGREKSGADGVLWAVVLLKGLIPSNPRVLGAAEWEKPRREIRNRLTFEKSATRRATFAIA